MRQRNKVIKKQSNKEGTKIKHFTDLKVWEKSHLLVPGIYKTTCNFPEEEKYGLINQIRRAKAYQSQRI